MGKDKSTKDPNPEIDGAAIMADGRLSVLRSTNEADLLKNANAAKKYIKSLNKELPGNLHGK